VNATVPLWSVARPLRETVEPSVLGTEVLHYSIPALESTGGPVIEPSESIKSQKLRIRGGELLVSKLNPRKSRVLITSPIYMPTVASTEFVAFRPFGADAHYLAYLLSSELARQTLDSNVRSVTRSHQRVEPEIIARLSVPVISLEEQRRIADFLDTETARIDHLLTLRVQQEAALTAQHDAAITESIEHAILSTSARRARLKYSGARIAVGIVVTPAAWYVEAGGVPAVRGIDVSPGAINTQALIRISAEGHRRHPKSRLVAGAVVVVRTGKAGAACVVPPDLDGANAIDVLIIKPGPNLHSKYLEHILNSEQTRRFVDEFSVGTIQSHFNVATLSELPIPTLDFQHQVAVADHLESLAFRQELLLDAISSQRQVLAERRQTLITAAVTGEFNVTTARGVSA